MTASEFEQQASEWQRKIEEVLIGMALVTTENNLFVLRHSRLGEVFMEDVEKLRIAQQANEPTNGLYVNAQ